MSNRSGNLPRPRFLRVVNREKFQHYKDRCPPWIKMHRTLITGEDKQLDDFLRLEEWEQWQLARIWLLASQCEGFLMVFDEKWIRRAIRTMRRVPLDRFVELGFLEVLSAADLTAAQVASTAASTALAAEGGNLHEIGEEKRSPIANESSSTPDGAFRPATPVLEPNGASAALASSASTLANARARRAGTEKTEKTLRTMNSLLAPKYSGRHFPTNSLPRITDPEKQMLVGKLVDRIGDHADPGTPHVVGRYATVLPSASLAKVLESLTMNNPVDRAAYAVGALRQEFVERTRAA